jgi:hypothetical protein
MKIQRRRAEGRLRKQSERYGGRYKVPARVRGLYMCPNSDTLNWTTGLLEDASNCMRTAEFAAGDLN